MGEEALISLAAIVVLGIGAQWLAWRLQFPSILLLLLGGFIAGPVTGLVDPDHLLGETLFPIVSISVGIILFEGGLTLRIGELSDARRVVVRLISIGALVTWIVGTLGAYYIVGLDFELSLLIGAVFIVSGPTVVLPLLKHVRPKGQVGPILKWEGILIDPVGATVAVLVFEVILVGHANNGTVAAMVEGVIRTILVGSGFGLLAAFILIQLFKRYWVPEHLQNPFTIMLIVAAFAASNEIQSESGLLATTLMGIVLANQKSIRVKHISQFKEEIGVLLLSGLFVILAARLDLDSLSNLSVRALLFLALLLFVARPLSVWLSTAGSRLNWRERVFLAWLAPRGIVAVSVASLFALRLEQREHPHADMIVPLTFLIVVGTVVAYGLSASTIARRLGLTQPERTGILIVGAHDWAREIAAALRQAGRTVLLVDTNWKHVSQARLEGLEAVYASILSDQLVEEEADLSHIGRLLAMTRNDEVNAMATLRFAEFFGRANVFQLPMHPSNRGRKGINIEQHGRCLFDGEATHEYLTRRFESGAVIKSVKLTKEFDYAAFKERYNDTALPLFMVDAAGSLSILTTDNNITPRVSNTLISLVDSQDRTVATVADTQQARLAANGVSAR